LIEPKIGQTNSDLDDSKTVVLRALPMAYVFLTLS
jgi:hypothetical protein